VFWDFFPECFSGCFPCPALALARKLDFDILDLLVLLDNFGQGQGQGQGQGKPMKKHPHHAIMFGKEMYEQENL
jgi:hypothetical protein